MTLSTIGIQWPARAESIDVAADKVARLVRALADIDPLLTGWRAKGRSRREAVDQPIVTNDSADIGERLIAGRNRRDTDNEVIEELGYSVYWWNGSDDATAVKLNISIGVTSQRVNNRVTINLPDSSKAHSLYTLPTALSLLSALIEIFAPNNARWASSDLTTEQCEPDKPLDGGGLAYGTLIGYAAGWATYLADSASAQFDRGLLPRSAEVARVGNGTLVLIGDDPAHPPLDDVLRVRIAMGYDVPRHPELAAERGATPLAGIGKGQAPPEGAFKLQSVQKSREVSEGGALRENIRDLPR